MNERIKLLALQAKITFTDYGSGEFLDENDIDTDRLEKFAELIVKECAKFLEENSGYDNANNAWHPEPEELLQHFGVE